MFLFFCEKKNKLKTLWYEAASKSVQSLRFRHNTYNVQRWKQKHDLQCASQLLAVCVCVLRFRGWFHGKEKHPKTLKINAKEWKRWKEWAFMHRIITQNVIVITAATVAAADIGVTVVCLADIFLDMYSRVSMHIFAVHILICAIAQRHRQPLLSRQTKQQQQQT